MTARAVNKAIHKYWIGCGIFDLGTVNECFACRRECSLQRAHLIPNSVGGTGDPENLVLLCARCHREAPMIGSSAQPMIDWIGDVVIAGHRAAQLRYEPGPKDQLLQTRE